MELCIQGIAMHSLADIRGSYAFRALKKKQKAYTYMYISIWIYIYTSVLLCISMHRESGFDSEVDHIVKLIWSNVCITIYITISITNLTTIVA